MDLKKNISKCIVFKIILLSIKIIYIMSIEKKNTKKRNILIDTIRGIAFILMITKNYFTDTNYVLC